MNTPIRYIILVLGLIIALHSILTFTHEAYGRATSLSNLTSKFRSGSTHPTPPNPLTELLTDPSIPHTNPNTPQKNPENGYAKANATLLILARNSDLDGTITSMREVEDRFNRKYGYPWVFLNEEPFTEEFIKRVSVLTSAPIEFGVIPPQHWYQPDWIDEDKASASRGKMMKDGIIYGGSVSYRNMCRFNSGFFYRHELVQKYRYYWRVEPDVHFHCDVEDPFVFMEREKKIYGFTIALYEYEATISTLWAVVKDFIAAHPQYIAHDNALGFLTDNGGNTYNLCHFWSNFEIADMDFWRGEAYTAFFDYLDSHGGFYYERWGDAPVHSIAAALFASKDQIHFFNEIGYEHAPYMHCPRGDETWTKGRCGCDPKQNFDYDGYSCMKQWERLRVS